MASRDVMDPGLRRDELRPDPHPLTPANAGAQVKQAEMLDPGLRRDERTRMPLTPAEAGAQAGSRRC